MINEKWWYVFQINSGFVHLLLSETKWLSELALNDSVAIAFPVAGKMEGPSGNLISISCLPWTLSSPTSISSGCISCTEN